MKKIILTVIAVMFTFALTAYDWPQKEQDGFMYGCMSNGVTWEVCNCSKLWLMKRFSIDNLKNATVQDMLDAAEACKGK